MFMKNRKRKILSFIGLLAAILIFVFVACDMTNLFDENESSPGNDGGREISDEERDNLEKTGHFLKLTNMPRNIQAPNVFSVQIANSSTNIGKLRKDSNALIYRENDTSTVYLLLSYNNDAEFTETGYFYSAFTIHIDAVTKYIVEISDKFLVNFTDGRGEADIRNLPEPGGGGSREISNRERDELEKTGRFLKLTNMPRNIQAPNIFSVQIANSSTVIGKLAKDSTALIYRDDYSSTVYLPLSYNNDTEFTETGFFYTAFTIHVDAVTKYIVEVSDKFLVYFIDGRGEADIRNLPEKAFQIVEPSYLTIYGLPANLSARNVSNVFVHNLAGPVAKCADYSLVEISVNSYGAAARIPLAYNNLDSCFTETGVYFVSFDINVDAELRYLFTAEDRIQVSFNDGNGFLDVLNIPKKPEPRLVISGLPLYTVNHHFTGISVYNLAGAVASCSDSARIEITSDGQYATALIPLLGSSGNGLFTGNGPFIVTFTVNVDAETQISVTRDINLTLQFSNGSASFDYLTFYGYFNASLTGDAVPTIMAGSSFDVDGYRHTVSGNTPVSASTPYRSCILYLYAYRLNENVYYEYSTDVPSYSELKRGYYSGRKRALWKMVYLHESGQFLLKTYIGNNFPQLGSVTVSGAVFNSFISGMPVHYYLSGSGNPAATSITLQSGVYAVVLSGAGGAGGYGAVSGSTVTGSSAGGSGGAVAEIFTLEKATAFTVFTGSGGYAAPSPSPSGTFTIVGYRLRTVNEIHYGPSSSEVNGFSLTYDTNLTTVYTRPSASGGGGGGGGAGSFLYSQEGYFLCAGAGGGGSGASYLTPGGAGGAGGTVGSGGAGGAAGYLQQSFNSNEYMTASGGHGGNGGGSNGGSGGQSTGTASNRNGGNGHEILLSNASLSGGNGTASYSAASFNINDVPEYTLRLSTFQTGYGSSYQPANINYTISGPSGNGGSTPSVFFPSGPQTWLNTNNAGGAGAVPPSLDSISSSWSPNSRSITIVSSVNSYYALSFSFNVKNGANGSAGGNNRNSVRGGGAPGGSVAGDLPSNGSDGSVTIYKIY